MHSTDWEDLYISFINVTVSWPQIIHSPQSIKYRIQLSVLWRRFFLNFASSAADSIPGRSTFALYCRIIIMTRKSVYPTSRADWVIISRIITECRCSSIQCSLSYFLSYSVDLKRVYQAELQRGVTSYRKDAVRKVSVDVYVCILVCLRTETNACVYVCVLISVHINSIVSCNMRFPSVTGVMQNAVQSLDGRRV